jgi:hypothetical protein
VPGGFVRGADRIDVSVRTDDDDAAGIQSAAEAGPARYLVGDENVRAHATALSYSSGSLASTV